MDVGLWSSSRPPGGAVALTSSLSRPQIQSQLNKALDDMSVNLCTLKEGMSYTKQLPPRGLSQSQVLDRIREYETLSKSPDPLKGLAVFEAGTLPPPPRIE